MAVLQDGRKCLRGWFYLRLGWRVTAGVKEEEGLDLAEGDWNVAQGHVAQDHGQQEGRGQSRYLVELHARLQRLDVHKPRGVRCLHHHTTVSLCMLGCLYMRLSLSHCACKMSRPSFWSYQASLLAHLSHTIL